MKGFGLILIIISIAILAALIAGGGLYNKEIQNQKSMLQIGVDAEQKALELKAKIEKSHSICTQDVQACPDGSYVGRSGPDCAFDTCPQMTPKVGCHYLPNGQYVCY